MGDDRLRRSSAEIAMSSLRMHGLSLLIGSENVAKMQGGKELYQRLVASK